MLALNGRVVPRQQVDGVRALKGSEERPRTMQFVVERPCLQRMSKSEKAYLKQNPVVLFVELPGYIGDCGHVTYVVATGEKQQVPRQFKANDLGIRNIRCSNDVERVSVCGQMGRLIE